MNRKRKKEDTNTTTDGVHYANLNKMQPIVINSLISNSKEDQIPNKSQPLDQNALNLQKQEFNKSEKSDMQKQQQDKLCLFEVKQINLSKYNLSRNKGFLFKLKIK